MTRPSEPLLRWLRARIDTAGHSPASLADKLGRPRGEVRRILTGAESAVQYLAFECEGSKFRTWSAYPQRWCPTK